MGALDKCSSYIKMVRKDGNPVLVFDTGDFLTAIPDSERAEYIINAVNAVGYDFITPGDQEFLLGEYFFYQHFVQSYVESAVSSIKDRLLCCNLILKEYDSEHENGYSLPGIHTEIMNGIPIKIIGITATESFLFFPNENKGWFEVIPWDIRLNELLSSEESDELLILLSHSGAAIDEEIARSFPAIDVIVGGHSQTNLEQPIQIGKTLIIQTGGSGRYVGRMDINVDDEYDISQYRYQLIPMIPEIPSDTMITQLIENYEYAFFKDKIPRPHIPVFPDSLLSMSAENCQYCHEEQYNQWSQTPHAHAFDIIEYRKKIYNPGCLSCHTTGFGHPSGFVSLESTPQLKHVSCSECHYLPAGHFDEPYRFRPDVITEKTCLRCHNKRSSPDFDYRQYYDKVRH